MEHNPAPTTYRVVLPFGESFLIRAVWPHDWQDIWINFDPDEQDECWRRTGRQVADRTALRTHIADVLRACGRDWYTDPTDERPDDSVIHDLIAASSIEDVSSHGTQD